MLLWKFMTYVAPSGRCDVQDTINRFNDGDRERFARAVAHLAVREQAQWHEPQAKKIKAQGELFEVRFKANNNQTRALGYFGPEPGQFTITLIATHKQNVYKPHNAFDTAGRRAKDVQAGEAGIAPLQVDGEDYPPDDE